MLGSLKSVFCTNIWKGEVTSKWDTLILQSQVTICSNAWMSCIPLSLQLFVPLVAMRLGVTAKTTVNACKQYSIANHL